MSATAEIATTPKSSGVVRYEPRQKIGSVGTLKSLLDMQMANIAQVLPRHITPERLAKTLFLAVNRTPKLLECTQASVMESIMRAAELGLDVSGTLGLGYLVPYGNQAQFIPGYRGLVKLARNSGELHSIEAEVVHEADHFAYEKGSNPRIEFRPKLDGDRGKPRGVYALAVLKSGEAQAVYLSVAEVEKVRRVSRAGGSGPWAEWWEEMAKKTAIRRLAKLLPLESEKWARAIEAANAEFDLDAMSSGAGAMVTAEMLLPSDPEPKAIEATATARISAEAIARIRSTAAESGILPLELESLVAGELDGLALEDAEPAHESVILEAIARRVKFRGPEGRKL